MLLYFQRFSLMCLRWMHFFCLGFHSLNLLQISYWRRSNKAWQWPLILKSSKRWSKWKWLKQVCKNYWNPKECILFCCMAPCWYLPWLHSFYHFLIFLENQRWQWLPLQKLFLPNLLSISKVSAINWMATFNVWSQSVLSVAYKLFIWKLQFPLILIWLCVLM